MKKAKEVQKRNIYLGFIDHAKAFDCVDHNELWKALKRWEYQTVLLVSWEICIRVKKQQLVPCTEQLIGSGIEKGVGQGCLLSLCLFKLYAERIMRNAELDELQVGIKIGR